MKGELDSWHNYDVRKQRRSSLGGKPSTLLASEPRVERQPGRAGGDVALPLLFPGERISMKRLARSAGVCALLFACVHVSANVQIYICVHVCMQVRTCSRVFMHACACASVHMYLRARMHLRAYLCVCVCTRASGPAICDEGISKQSRAARGQLLLLFSSLSLTGTKDSAARAATLFRQSVGSASWRCR